MGRLYSFYLDNFFGDVSCRCSSTAALASSIEPAYDSLGACPKGFVWVSGPPISPLCCFCFFFILSRGSS
jgi:hypothetical protein